MNKRILEPHLPDDAWRDPCPVTEAKKLLALVHRLYRPRAVWSLCSGGNDSLCSTHVAMSTGLVTGVASINTTIGIQETRDHMQAVAERFGWPLRWLTPPMNYRDLCAKFGMPGPGAHALAYSLLKERCVNQLIRESKKKRRDRIILVNGCRVAESERRMGHVKPLLRDGAKLWVPIIINWSEGQKTVYQTDHHIPRNPVRPVLGISGECLCGAFAKPGEREKIAKHYPLAFAEIVACERVAAQHCKPSAWGERPPKTQHMCQDCTRKNIEN